MQSNSEVSKLLIKTGAFKDLDNPVILTSGELGIYYINTEKLLQDGGAWKDFGDSSFKMIQHAIKTSQENPNFGRIIDILTETTLGLMDWDFPLKRYFISGGQRRDWLFSGPVADNLGLKHISLYKDGKMESVNTQTGLVQELNCLESPMRAIHIVDLVTEASSVYRLEGRIQKGWVPSQRRKNIKVNNLVAVVDRDQGGREKLRNVGVELYSHAVINEQFVREHSTNPERAIEYMKDPTAWSKAYLRENGALALIGTFNPESGNLDRAGKFLSRYEGVLRGTGKMQELEEAVRDKYDTNISDIK